VRSLIQWRRIEHGFEAEKLCLVCDEVVRVRITCEPTVRIESGHIRE
jgi:hypothetical protein